jgi:hypothetical protein
MKEAQKTVSILWLFCEEKAWAVQANKRASKRKKIKEKTHTWRDTKHAQRKRDRHRIKSKSAHTPHFNFNGREVMSTREGAAASAQRIAECATRPGVAVAVVIKHCSARPTW